MRNIKDFQARYDRWKNGERYWDIRGVDLPRYNTGYKNTNQEYIFQRPDGTYYSSPTNNNAFTEDVTPVLKRDLSNPATWDFVGSDTNKKYTTQYTDDQLRQIAQDSMPNAEMIPWVDRAGNKQRSARVIGLSPADPVTSLAVEYAMGLPGWKALDYAGNKLAVDFARDFAFTKLGNWTRNKILSNQLNKNIKNLDGIVLPNGKFKYNGSVLPYKRIELPQKQGNGRYQFDSPTYQMYTGPKHDVSEIINADGSINLRNLLNIQNEALQNIPGGTIARHRLENQKWHPTDWNTFLHTRDVYKRALQYGYPEEALFPALMHDFGKMWAGDGHGPYGASIVHQIFPKASENQIQAIYGHMDKNPINSLTKLVKGVDIKETNPFRTEWIMRKMEDQGIKDNFDVVPFFDDVYELNPIKGSPFDNYNNYIHKRLNRNPEYGHIYIQPGKDLNRAGSFSPITEISRIYHLDNDQLNTAVHEAISHKTDNLVENELTSKFIPKTDVNYVNVPTSTYYTDLADIDGNSWFRSGTYEDWREMRATLNELRSMNRNINNVSDSELLDDLAYVNGYGQRYTKLLRQLDDSARKKWFSKFRTAYKYLPVSIPLISPLNKDNSYEKEK